MSRPLNERATWATAIAVALPAFLFPAYNPDVFWHLSAGRWIVEHRALPYSEFLSFSTPGKAWADFEWLSQVLFHFAFAAGGFTGLWLLKTLLLAACWRAFDGSLRVNEAPLPVRAAALVFWALNAFAFSDIRPELFSLLLFSLLLRFLEAFRLGKLEAGFVHAAGLAALFSLWSNLHAGFPFGLILIAIYAAGSALEGHLRRAAVLAGGAALAAAAALANPYGAGPYRVAYEHWLVRQDLSRYIQEWHPMSAANPLHWPFWAMLGFCVVAVAARMAEPYGRSASWARPVPWAPILLCGHLGANSLMHARVSAYFGIAACLLLGIVASEARGALKALALAALAAGIAFMGWVTPRLYWGGPFNGKYVPARAAAFLERQEPAAASLRLFNQWEWGGYLAWRLRPWYRVFSDGRYIFHDQLPEVSRASESPETWRAFMERNRLNGALVPNRAAMQPSRRLYPDGGFKDFERPWYVSFFPREKWALIYWDDQALLFVDRSAVPRPWLAAHEYRYFKPRDAAAFNDAFRRGEIPAAALAAEKARHAQEAAPVELLAR